MGGVKAWALHARCMSGVYHATWTPHASVSPTHLLYIFYKCAKLCGLCQEWWFSSAGTSLGQAESTVASGPCHSLQGLQARSVLPQHRETEMSGSTFIVSQYLWFPCLPTLPEVKAHTFQAVHGTTWPGSGLLVTCRGMMPCGT